MYKENNIKLSRLITILLFLVLLFSGVYFALEKTAAEDVYINKVIDGDTVISASGKKIRLLGIDSPEINWEQGSAEYFAWEARDYVIEKLLNKKVNLEYDIDKNDDYGRILAYLFLDGNNFNLKLLEEGYAGLMIVSPNDKYRKSFVRAAEGARKNGRGIWNKVEYYSDKLPIISYREAEKYIGEEVIVKGEIVNTAKTEEVSFLNFSQNYQNTLSLVIFNHNLIKFSYQPDEYLKNREIKVMGKVKLYQGVPEIIVEEAENIMLVEN